jgi:hypothetical protein
MSRDEINELIWSLPVSERCALLVGSIVEGKLGPVRPIAGLISVTAAMARMLSVTQRFQIASRLRDVADELEQQPAAVQHIEIK